MYLIATGYNKLDETLSQNLDGSKIINYREFLLKQAPKQDTIIISSKLQGDIDMDKLLFSLKEKNNRIIYLTNREDIRGILNCFKLSIFDFLLDPITLENILDLINNPNEFSDVSSLYLEYSSLNPEIDKEPLRFNIENNVNSTEQTLDNNSNVKIVEKKVVEKIVETRLIKQNIITFFGADNNIANNIALVNSAFMFQKKAKQKMLLIDFNLYPCLDHLLNVNKEIMVKDNYNVNKIDTGLSACYASIENQKLTPSLLQKFIIHSKSGLDVLTGLYDDDLVAQKLELNHYERILDITSQMYDSILISVNPFKFNTATAVSINKSNKIICVSEGSYTSARNTISCLKTFLDIGITIDKFGIVVFNTYPKSIEDGVMKRLFQGYNFITELPYNKHYNKCLNSKTILINSLNATREDKKAYSQINAFMGLDKTRKVIKARDNSSDILDNFDTDIEKEDKGFIPSILSKITSFKK